MLDDIYKVRYGESHESGLRAVWDAGYAAGLHFAAMQSINNTMDSVLVSENTGFEQPLPLRVDENKKTDVEVMTSQSLTIE